MYFFILCAILFNSGVTNAFIRDTEWSKNKPEELVMPQNVTPSCLAHTEHWLSELRRGIPWAVSMLDSYTKLPSGVLWGTDNLGNFDQCVSISMQDDVANFQGHYCRAKIGLLELPEQPLNYSNLMYAFCLPSSCKPEEIPTLLEQYISPAIGIKISTVILDPKDCYIKEPYSPLPTGALIFIVIGTLLTTLVIICALLEWRLGDKTPALVRACSLTSTCRSLFDTRKHPADIACLHGIRVGSMLWIILGHRYGDEIHVPITNPNIFAEYWAQPIMMTLGNTLLSVDTFLLLSGLLMCTSFLREVQRNKNFDVIKFYVYRYLRLSISLTIVVIFYITILPILSNGPISNQFFYKEARNCKANWWVNVLFVNNYIFNEGFSMCVGQSWYTAVDMQLAWLSPLVLLPLYHSPRAGLQLMTLLILISCFIPFTLTYIYKFYMSSLQVYVQRPLDKPVGNQGAMIYYATQSRATPYLCGLLFGYYLYNTRKQKITLSKSWVYTGWTLGTVVALAVIYTLSIAHQVDYVYDDVGSAFYAGFHRLGWSASIIWIIFACVKGYGGLADKILSWNLLLPISRLTYSIYLVQFIIIIYDQGTTRTLSQYNDYDAVHDFFGDLLPVFFLAFLLYVIVEGPLLTLLRIVFNKGKQTPSTDKKVTNKVELLLTKEEKGNNL